MRIPSANSFLGFTNLNRLLFFLSSSALLVVALSTTLLWGNTFPMAFYFFAIITAATLWAAYTLPTGENWEWTNQEVAIAVFLLFLTLAAFATRFYQLGEVQPWCDEDWHNMRLPRSPDVVGMAAWINQPPVHYYFSKFAMQLMGRSLFAIRFFPAFFGALTVPLFFSFLKKTCKSLKYALAGSLALLFNIWLISYAKEAKPYSGGIFFTLLFLHSLFEFLVSPRNKKLWISLVITGALALLSVGLQPLLLMFGCAILFSLYYLAAREILTAFLTALALLAAAVIFAPFQIYLIQSSLKNNGFVKQLNLLQFLRNDLVPNIQLNLQTYQQIMNNGLFYLAPLLSAALIFRLFAFGRSKHSSRSAMQLGMLGMAHLFPIIFLFAFGLVVNSPIFPRYLLLYIPIFIAGVAYSFETAEDQLRALLPRWSSATSLAFTLALAIITLPHFYFSAIDRSKKAVEFKWVNFYKYVRENSELKNAVGFIFTMAYAPIFSHDGFIHTDFFYTPELRKKIRINSEWDVFMIKTQLLQIFEQLDSGVEPSHIIFFYLNGETQAPMTKYIFSPVLEAKIIPFPESIWQAAPWDATLVSIKNKLGFAGTLERFFLDIERQEENKDFKLKIYEALMGIQLVRKDCAQAKLYYRKLAPCGDPASQFGVLEAFCRDFAYLRERMNRDCPVR